MASSHAGCRGATGAATLHTATTQKGGCVEALAPSLARSQSERLLPGGAGKEDIYLSDYLAVFPNKRAPSMPVFTTSLVSAPPPHLQRAAQRDSSRAAAKGHTSERLLHSLFAFTWRTPLDIDIGGSGDPKRDMPHVG